MEFLAKPPRVAGNRFRGGDGFMEVNLQLVFLNEAGNRVTISIPTPREDLPVSVVEAAMDEIITADVFVSPGGGLANKVRASLVSRQTEILAEF